MLEPGLALYGSEDGLIRPHCMYVMLFGQTVSKDLWKEVFSTC
jgi:hypothetical protein